MSLHVTHSLAVVHRQLSEVSADYCSVYIMIERDMQHTYASTSDSTSVAGRYNMLSFDDGYVMTISIVVSVCDVLAACNAAEATP